MNYQWISQTSPVTSTTAPYGPLGQAVPLTAPSAPYGSMPTMPFQIPQLQPHMSHSPLQYTSTLTPTSLPPQLGSMPTTHLVQLPPTIQSIPTSTQLHPFQQPDPTPTWGLPAMLVTPSPHSPIWPQAIPPQAAAPTGSPIERSQPIPAHHGNERRSRPTVCVTTCSKNIAPSDFLQSLSLYRLWTFLCTVLEGCQGEVSRLGGV